MLINIRDSFSLIVRLMTCTRQGDISLDTALKFFTSMKSSLVAFDPLSLEIML